MVPLGGEEIGSFPSLPAAITVFSRWTVPTPTPSFRVTAGVGGHSRTAEALLTHVPNPLPPYSVLPEPLEPVRRKFRVPHRVLDVSVAQVVLNGPRVLAVVGEQRDADQP